MRIMRPVLFRCDCLSSLFGSATSVNHYSQFIGRLFCSVVNPHLDTDMNMFAFMHCKVQFFAVTTKYSFTINSYGFEYVQIYI